MAKSKPFFWQVTLFLPPAPVEISEVLGETLIGLGSSAVEQVFKRKRLIALRAYYSPKRNSATLRKTILAILDKWQKNLPQMRNCKIRLRKFQDQDWKEKWKAFIKPLVLGRILAILPKHDQTTLKRLPRKALVIRLDPGLAFGTGRHPTTYLCLQEILTLLQRQKRKVRACLDLGTGSGILAMACAKLGVPKVVALDTDPMAIAVARENFRTNRVEKKINAFQGSIGDTHEKFDFIVANILLEPILSMLGPCKNHLKSKGHLIVSGILNSQAKELEQGLRKHKLRIMRKRQWRGWLCVVARRS